MERMEKDMDHQTTAFQKPIFLHDSPLLSVAPTLTGAYNEQVSGSATLCPNPSYAQGFRYPPAVIRKQPNRW